VRWIERDYDQAVGLGQVTLSSIIQTSADFAVTATHYRFVKLNKITVTVYPQTESTRLYVLLRYTDDTGASAIEQNDSTKVVQTHAVKNRLLKWFPPNASLFVSRNSGNNYTNYTVWSICDDLLSNGSYVIPGDFLIKINPFTSGTTKVSFRVALQFTFRGADIPDASKLIKLATIVAGIEKKSEKKRLDYSTPVTLRPCDLDEDGMEGEEEEEDEEETEKWKKELEN
jgi:hypothetical protein